MEELGIYYHSLCPDFDSMYDGDPETRSRSYQTFLEGLRDKYCPAPSEGFREGSPGKVTGDQLRAEDQTETAPSKKHGTTLSAGSEARSPGEVTVHQPTAGVQTATPPSKKLDWSQWTEDDKDDDFGLADLLKKYGITAFSTVEDCSNSESVIANSERIHKPSYVPAKENDPWKRLGDLRRAAIG
ncbi:hypothetical protein P7C73_g1425, partial [Tremellales sp. Uapishka_1]